MSTNPKAPWRPSRFGGTGTSYSAGMTLCGSGLLTVVDSTFHRNGRANVGGGMTAWIDLEGTIDIANVDLIDNSAEDSDGGPLTVGYSNIEGGFVGAGNIDLDPVFVDPDHRDYRLLPGSACIDAGIDTALPDGWADYGGHPLFRPDVTRSGRGIYLSDGDHR